MKRRFYAIEGGASKALAQKNGAAALPPIRKDRQEAVPDIRLKEIAASGGRAAVWPLRRAIVLRHRSTSGAMISLTIPFSHFRGVSVAVDFGKEGRIAGARVILVHRDKALEVELFHAVDDLDVIAEWRGWGRDLGLPLLMRLEDGDEAAGKAVGALRMASAGARRPLQANLRRRPLIARRRGAGLERDLPVFDKDQEIIAYP